MNKEKSLIDYESFYHESEGKRARLEIRVRRLIKYLRQDKSYSFVPGSDEVEDLILYLKGLEPHYLDGKVIMRDGHNDWII